jgi:hypothetical protein
VACLDAGKYAEYLPIDTLMPENTHAHSDANIDEVL